MEESEYLKIYTFRNNVGYIKEIRCHFSLALVLAYCSSGHLRFSFLAVLWIRIRKDPHYFESKDPDPGV